MRKATRMRTRTTLTTKSGVPSPLTSKTPQAKEQTRSFVPEKGELQSSRSSKGARRAVVPSPLLVRLCPQQRLALHRWQRWVMSSRCGKRTPRLRKGGKSVLPTSVGAWRGTSVRKIPHVLPSSSTAYPSGERSFSVICPPLQGPMGKLKQKVQRRQRAHIEPALLAAQQQKQQAEQQRQAGPAAPQEEAQRQPAGPRAQSTVRANLPTQSLKLTPVLLSMPSAVYAWSLQKATSSSRAVTCVCAKAARSKSWPPPKNAQCVDK